MSVRRTGIPASGSTRHASTSAERRTHLAFGSGIHACVGAAIVRLEAEALLSALVRRVRALHVAAEPTYQPNNIVRALGSVPLRIVAA